MLSVKLDEELTRRLKELSRRHGATLFMTVLAGWALVLSKLSGQTDLVIGSPSANRDRLEAEGVIGVFVNTLALRVDLSGNPTVSELLGQVRTVVVDAQANAQLPFERVVKLLKPARTLSHTPIFQVNLGWQLFETPNHFPGLTVQTLSGSGLAPAKFDLTLNLGELDGCIVGSLIYATALFDAGRVENMLALLRETLEGMSV